MLHSYIIVGSVDQKSLTVANTCTKSFFSPQTVSFDKVWLDRFQLQLQLARFQSGQNRTIIGSFFFVHCVFLLSLYDYVAYSGLQGPCKGGPYIRCDFCLKQAQINAFFFLECKAKKANTPSIFWLHLHPATLCCALI